MAEPPRPDPTQLEETPLRLDRRAVGRYPCRRSPFVRVLARPSFQMHRAFLQDVSPQGLGLILDRSFDIGTLLAIQLRTVHAGVSGILTARVIHVTAQPDGSWLLGCSLNRRLTDEEIFHLL
jgi:PilZ domain